MPAANVADIASVPTELFAKFQPMFYFAKFQPMFYVDPVDTVFKALGVQ
jgi:predicted ATP-dependent Lon-type protease